MKLMASTGLCMLTSVQILSGGERICLVHEPRSASSLYVVRPTFRTIVSLLKHAFVPFCFVFLCVM